MRGPQKFHLYLKYVLLNYVDISSDNVHDLSFDSGKMLIYLNAASQTDR